MLDLDHLSRQTMGNAALEREVLMLFANRVDVLVERLQSAESVRERSEAIHTIVGSALAIGAFDVVRLAERIDPADREMSGDIREMSGDIAALVEVVKKTRAFIVDRLTE